MTAAQLAADPAGSTSGRVLAAPETDSPAPSRWLLAALAVGAFVGMVDATLVAVALDPMGRHFGVPLSAAQEVLGLYLVTVTACLPTVGRAGDRFGRRRVYLAGFGIFAAGSVVAALAPTFTALLAGRVVQAVGGGMLTAGSLALMAENVPRRRGGRSIALLVITQAVAGLVGPPLGGLLTVLGGWQAVFWAGVPLAAGGAALTIWRIPVSPLRRPTSLDLPGAVLTAAMLLGLGAGIASIGGPVIGDVPAAAWLSVAWLSLLLLVPAEMIASNPILDGRLLRQPRFSVAALASFLSTGTLMSCFALLPFWLERAHGWSALGAGAAFIPIAVGIGATSRLGGSLGDAGRTRLATTAGMLIAALGFALSALAAISGQWLLLFVGLLLVGAGNGCFSSPNTAAAIGLVRRSAVGGGAGLLSTARNAGVITGLGITGAIYTAAGGHADNTATRILLGAAVICIAVAVISAWIHRNGVRRD